ncbi:type VI secretion system tip protein VgrG, partial [Chromobacterium haemolyticum]|nr:type VI secretion system tip protein VgrG [Chromobacterium haemolyticum]MBO0418516.1 type VI secretion system tip protein VgrG [Chromobacterium haemolyticum]MBO0501890.1 type VI secretion system tip protein VgrG [Chromobacterium haemolyticum]
VTRQTLSARNNLPADLKALAKAEDAQPFRAEFDAQRRGVPLTPAYAHTELAKPKSRGVQTATVVGPQGEEVHTD